MVTRKLKLMCKGFGTGLIALLVLSWITKSLLWYIMYGMHIIFMTLALLNTQLRNTSNYSVDKYYVQEVWYF